MYALMDDEEARAARIDEATRDWLESQVFPEIPLISEGNNHRLLDAFVSPVKQPVVLGSVFFAATKPQAVA
jgi:hypothetical protein